MNHVPPARVTLTALRVRACVGVTDDERRKPQQLLCDCRVDLVPGFDPSRDDIHDTVDYGRLARRIREVSARSGARLLERLAWEIASEVLSDFPAAQGVFISVTKTGRIPECDGAGVEIALSRGPADGTRL